VGDAGREPTNPRCEHDPGPAADDRDTNGLADSAAIVASLTVRRMPMIVDTSTCHLHAASAWVISRDVTCKKISHFVSGDNTRGRQRPPLVPSRWILRGEP
jgi:hypothetical protein